MSIDLGNYKAQTQQAVQTFWETREHAKNKQVRSGKLDQGERAGVTAGKNMDGFLSLAIDIVKLNGLPGASIQLKKKVLTLPGYFRPTKLWDMLVVNDGRLIAALEFKSQVGPSFGNNTNNRAEEAIGTAHDLWVAYREGAFGEQTKPFVGWLMLLEDAPGCRKPVSSPAPHFPVLPEYRGASYADRYDLLCRKLIQEQLYSSATLLLSPKSALTGGKYSELSELTGIKTFVTGLAAHVAAEAARLKP